MRVTTYIAVGILSALGFSLQHLPASWLWAMLGGHVAPMIPAQIESVGGSVWTGHAVFRPFVLMNERFLVAWDLSLVKLITGRVHTDLRLESRQAFVSGTLTVSPGAYRAENFDASLDLAMLRQLMQEYSVGATGLVKIDGLSVVMTDAGVIEETACTVRWSGGSVSYGYTGEDNYVIPPITGRLSARDGGAYLAVVEDQGGKPLGEAGISSDGIGSLTVLQRVMSLVGMQGTDDDKVLIKTQQPLF